MKNIKNYIVISSLIIMFIFYFYFSYGCLRKIDHNKNLINMILTYYPDYKIKIIDSDPNSVTINIFKGE